MLAGLLFCWQMTYAQPFNHLSPRCPQVFCGGILPKRNGLRLPLTLKKDAYLLVDIIMCTCFYATFTLILVIFRYQQYCCCTVIDAHLYIGIEHISLRTGSDRTKALSLSGKTKVLFCRTFWFISLCSAEVLKLFCMSFLLQKILFCSLFGISLFFLIRAQDLTAHLLPYI